MKGKLEKLVFWKFVHMVNLTSQCELGMMVTGSLRNMCWQCQSTVQNVQEN